MNLSDIPFNMTTSFNSSFHEQPNDIDEMRKGIDFLLQKVTESDSERETAILNIFIGHYMRIMSRQEDSLKHFKKAYSYFHEIDDKVHEIDLMYRIAIVHYYGNDFSICDDMLMKVISFMEKYPNRNNEKILHNVYFYLGLSKRAQGIRDLAEMYFSKCLEQRIVKGDIELIEQCQEAIMSLSRRN